MHIELNDPSRVVHCRTTATFDLQLYSLHAATDGLIETGWTTGAITSQEQLLFDSDSCKSVLVENTKSLLLCR